MSHWSVQRRIAATELTLKMEARPHKFLARLMTPLIKGMLTKALEKDEEKT